MVMDIDEVETDAPQGDAEEHLSSLASECLVECDFELVMIDGREAFEDAIATGRIGCQGADIVDGGLLGGRVKDSCPSVFGVKGATLDPWNRELIQVLKRYAFKVCSRNDLAWLDQVHPHPDDF